MGPVTSVPDSFRGKGCLPEASTVVVILSKTFKRGLSVVLPKVVAQFRSQLSCGVSS